MLQSFQKFIFALLSASILTGCSAATGPMTVRTQNFVGVKVVRLETWGIQTLSLSDFHSLHFGFIRHTLVFEDLASPGATAEESHFAIYQKLPDTSPVHCASTSIGTQLAWEPAFRGIALGADSRSTSRLRLDSHMTFENLPPAEGSALPRFQLQQFP